MPTFPKKLLTSLLAVALAVSGCVEMSLPGLSRQTADPFAAYRAALMPDHQSLLDGAENLPRYRLELRVDPGELTLQGRMQVTMPPAPEDQLPKEYYFRLYPNLDHYAGQMRVDLVKVNGQGAPFSYEASNTAVHVAVPPASLQPDQPAVVEMQWSSQVESFPPQRYTIFGESQGVISLPLAYPVLAEPKADQPGEWHLEQGLPQGDAAFTSMALYDVTVTVPEATSVVSTGSVVGVQNAPADADGAAPTGWKDWHIVAGPVREFALFLSDQYRLAETMANGVKINSWHLPGDEATGRAAAEYAAAALRLYSDLFGPYPYAELDVVAGPLTFRGMEYPGLFELGIDLYRDHADELEFRVAHEVSHQWWYNLVGNDPVNTPWLDEGLAEYSTYFYLKHTRGQDVADRLVRTRWQAALEYARQLGLDTVVDQPVEAFQPNNYETMVYGKAALFFHALQQAMGEAQFQALLQRYVEANRLRVAQPDDFMALAIEMAGPVSEDLYRQWIQETATSTPSTKTAP